MQTNKIQNNFLKPFLFIFLPVVILGGASMYFATKWETNNSKAEEIVENMPQIVPLEELYPYKISSKTTLSAELRKLAISPQAIHEIVDVAKPIRNLGIIAPGTRFQIYRSLDTNAEFTGIKFRFSPMEMLEIKKVNGAWAAEKITETVETKIVSFSGNVTSTLWESAEKANMDPNLISELAEIFAWQVDFAREVRIKDRWRLVVEQKLVKGEVVGWGSILAAEFENEGQMQTAVLFKNGETAGYFSPSGASLRRMFLKSPIKFGRISSRFQMRRFHPILKVNRPHMGVDYAAPTGTPIRSVGSGVIAYAEWRGGGGNAIRIRHNSIYETAYKHLSRFEKGIRPGVRVQQGQVIGYVGNTGLSTAPHLHFEFYQSGTYVDPLGKKFPSADPVPAQLLTQFQNEAHTVLATLPSWESVASAEPAAADRKPGSL